MSNATHPCPAQITNEDEARQFVHYVYGTLKLMWHPDESFDNYEVTGVDTDKLDSLAEQLCGVVGCQYEFTMRAANEIDPTTYPGMD